MNKKKYWLGTASFLLVVTQTFANENTTTELETLEVTASPFKTHSDLELAQPVDILSGDELMLRTKSTLGETVEQQLGVTASDFNPVGRGTEKTGDDAGIEDVLAWEGIQKDLGIAPAVLAELHCMWTSAHVHACER